MSTPVQTNGRRTPFGNEQNRDLPWVKVIPYDHVAEFQITGVVGNVTQDVISVSVEGVFVAVAIGHAFEEDRTAPITLAESSSLRSRASNLGAITLGDFSPDVLVEGFRIDPRFRSVALTNSDLNSNLDIQVANTIFQRIKPPQNFSFLFSIVDSATGRELQNEPVHSEASLGRSNGHRPFKPLTQPMVFMPRSTIRIQVEECMRDVTGKLVITLQGYKVLGVAGDLDQTIRTLTEMKPAQKVPVYDYQTGSYRSLGETIEKHIPTNGLVPFDYVSTVNLNGTPDRIVEDEVPVNVDGGHMTVAVGYSLDPQDTQIKIPVTSPNIALADIKLSDIKPAQALFDGIRIDPIKVRLAFNGFGLSTVPGDTAETMFQRLNLSDDVRFYYSIIDTGTGRELQSRPVHSIAGLGVANGDRPFRVLPKPMMFLPRSSIRVQVREISGRGRLYIVFQGYKMLN